MPDLLIVGTLHTQDPSRHGPAEAALVRDGHFARVGTRDECEAEAQPDVKFIELGAGCAVPGLIDAHGHPRLHGQMLRQIRLGGAKSEQECVDRMARYAQLLPPGHWILGGGWDHNLWASRAFPAAALLSAATPPHPLPLAPLHAPSTWPNYP